MSLSLYTILPILRCMQIVAVKISATDSHSHVNMIIYDTFAIHMIRQVANQLSISSTHDSCHNYLDIHERRAIAMKYYHIF